MSLGKRGLGMRLRAMMSHEIFWALPLWGMLLISYSYGYGIPYALFYVIGVSAHLFMFFGWRYKNLIDNNQFDFSVHRKAMDFRYLSKILFLIIVPLNLTALNINPWHNAAWEFSNLYHKSYDIFVVFGVDWIGIRNDYLRGLSEDLSDDFVNYASSLFVFLCFIIVLFMVLLPVYSYYQFCSWQVRVGATYAQYGRTRFLTSSFLYASIAAFYFCSALKIFSLIQNPDVDRSDLYAYFLSSAVTFFSCAPIFFGYFIVIALGLDKKVRAVRALNRNS